MTAYIHHIDLNIGTNGFENDDDAQLVADVVESKLDTKYRGINMHVRVVRGDGSSNIQLGRPHYECDLDEINEILIDVQRIASEVAESDEWWPDH